MSGWEDRYWQSADGLRLHYRDYAGKEGAPALLCLHGLTRNARDFEDFAPRYAGRFRVIAIDNRGRGGSEHDPIAERYQPLTYAYDVLKLLDDEAIAEAVFVGTSLGGLMTMLVAALQPQRIRASILNDVGPELADVGLERIKSYVGKPLVFADWDSAARQIAINNNQIPAGWAHGDWLRMARRICRQTDAGVEFDYDMRIAEAFNQPPPEPPLDMWPLFRALAQKPLLVVRGELSDLLSAETAQAMVAAGRDVRVVTVPGVAHAPHLDEPAAVEAIDDFLEQFAAAAAEL